MSDIEGIPLLPRLTPPPLPGLRISEPGEIGQAARPADQANGPDFLGMLEEGIHRVSTLQHDAKAKVQGLVTGETEDVHEVLVAMGKSEVAFQMMLEVRNKLVEAWKELTRIQV